MRRARGGELVFERVKQALATANAFLRLGTGADGLGRPDVFRRSAGVLHRERGIGHAEKARSIGGTANGDVVRQRNIVIAGQFGDFVCGHRADGGKRQRWVGRVGRVHQGAATGVIAFGGRQGADECQMAHLGGDGGHVFGDLDAGDGGVDFAELSARWATRL